MKGIHSSKSFEPTFTIYVWSTWTSNILEDLLETFFTKSQSHLNFNTYLGTL